MLLAATTLWGMFALWILAGTLDLPRLLEGTAAALMAAELVALLAWSYGTEGCAGDECSPFARAAGVAARVDIPILAALLLLAAFTPLLRGRRLQRR
jgi:hypothetical protein